MSCYFVTGAAGFIGRHLCRELRAQGHAVRALVRRPHSGLEELGVEVVPGDLQRSQTWAPAVAGADYIIHCAANAAFRGASAQTAINITGTRALLEAAQRTGASLRRFVFVSTIGAVDRAAGDDCAQPLTESTPSWPQSEYGRSKLRAEHMVRDSGLPFCIVRPAMVVGGDMRQDSHFAVFARMALRRAPLARLAWPGRFSVVHVDDLVAALILCATHPAAELQTYFCAGTPVTLGDCFVQAAPAEWRLPVRWSAGLARAAPRAVPFRMKALLLPALTACDAALQELGWRPRITADQALREVITRERARCAPLADPGGQTVITGAASGLGRALAERLGPHRRNLLLVDRDGAGLQRAADAHPQARIYVADLSDEEQVARFTRSPEWRGLPVRELFACAGIGIRGPTLDTSAEVHARMFKVNVLARVALAHAALREMVREQFGRVVFISSSSAFQPLPYMGSYAAANAALLSLGEAWAAELGGSGVQLLTVCPGGMQTNFQASAGVRQLSGERLMPPGEVAEKILRALAQQKSTAIISTRSFAMSLLARVLPRAVSVALWKQLMSRLR